MKKRIIVLFCICIILSNTFLISQVLGERKVEKFGKYPLYLVENSYDLLVLSPGSWKNNFENFMTHKEGKGIDTIIVGLDEVYSGSYFPTMGRDDPERIKYFIKNAMENWGIKYVLLVGNKDFFPVRYIQIQLVSTIISNKQVLKYPSLILSNVQDVISDLYYADIYDNNDVFCSWDSNNNSIFGESNEFENIDMVDFHPDIYIGRILCTSPEDIIIVTDKIIEYENNAYGQSWLNNLILCGGDTHAGFYEENIWLLFLLSKGYFHRRAFEGEYFCDKVADLLDDYNPVKCYASGFFNPSIKSLTVDNINDVINSGGSFFLYVGHGFGSCFGTHPPFSTRLWLPFPNMYRISDIEELSNGGMLPVAIFSACHCANFDYMPNPIGWEFIKHDCGGSIASIACTTVSYSPLTTYTTESYNGYLTMSIFEGFDDGIDILGDLWGYSIDCYLEDEGVWMDIFPPAIWMHYLCLEEWVLLGDPSLKIGGYP